MLKIGVLGAGSLGKTHIQCIKNIQQLELSGIYDPDHKRAASLAKETGIPFYDNIETLIQQADILDIVSPNINHYQCAAAAIKQSKHVFIDNLLSNTLSEAKSLIELSTEANVKVQVSQYERYNPAFKAALPHIAQPMFIESHRLTQFSQNKKNNSVVLDLMLHDIDIILSIVKSNIRKINANGTCVISNTPDIANARIEFDNGCVANLTASRISLINMQKCRLFQRDAYISIDYLKKESEIVRLQHTESSPASMPSDNIENIGEKVQLHFEKPIVDQSNAIINELETFIESILRNTPPEITAYDGYRSLDIAHQILHKIEYAAVL